MVQILEGNPSFAQSIASALGGGLGSGISQGAQFAQQMMAEKAKSEQEMEAIKKLFGKQPTSMGNSLTGRGREGPEGMSEYDQADPETKAYLSQKYPNIVRAQQQEENLREKKFESDRKYHTGRSGKFLDKITELSDGLREREIAVDSALSAVDSGQMSPMGGDFWADALNIPQLRTASGAQLQTSAKVNLMGSLGKIGARPNQFIEKQINDAFARSGETPTVQKAKLMITKAVMDLDKKYVELADQVANEDRETLGYVKEDVDSRTKRLLQPFSDDVMDKLSFDLQANREKEMKSEEFNAIRKVPKGTPLTLEKAAVIYNNKARGANEEERRRNAEAIARKAGYKIMPDEFYEALQ